MSDGLWWWCYQWRWWRQSWWCEVLAGAGKDDNDGDGDGGRQQWLLAGASRKRWLLVLPCCNEARFPCLVHLFSSSFSPPPPHPLFFFLLFLSSGLCSLSLSLICWVLEEGGRWGWFLGDIGLELLEIWWFKVTGVVEMAIGVWLRWLWFFLGVMVFDRRVEDLKGFGFAGNEELGCLA